jgi:ribosomal protein L15, bacterial/organelle
MTHRLSQLSPSPGAKKSSLKRVGRGMGSQGKTCGRGHKGQKSRTGGQVAVGFEGGQNPLQRRLPKRGFTSRVSRYHAQVRLSELNQIPAAQHQRIDLKVLKQLGVIRQHIVSVKIFASGNISTAMTLVGLSVTAGVRAAIEQAGGQVLDS